MKINVLLASILALGASIPVLQAQTWDTEAGTGNWSDGTKWVGGIAPANNSSGAYIFSRTGTSTNNLTGITASSITYDRTTSPGAFTIAGTNPITLAGNIGFSGANTASSLTINPNLILNGNRTITTTSINSVTVGGNISESGGARSITKSGQGSLTLSGANSFSGGITINNGSTTFPSAGALGSGTISFFGGDPTLVYNSSAGSTTTVTNNLTQSNSAAAGVVIIANNSVGSSNNVVFNGTFANSASHTTGTKTFTLRGSNTGDNQFQGAIGNGSGGGLIGLAKTEAGKWTITAANTYTGGTTVSAGELATSSTGTFGTGDITVSAGTLTLGNNTSIGDFANLRFSGTSTINLNFSGFETVGSLFSSFSGTYMSIGNKSISDLNAFFAGSNVTFAGIGGLNVSSAIPEPSTFATLAGLAVLASGLCSRRRSRRSAVNNW